MWVDDAEICEKKWDEYQASIGKAPVQAASQCAEPYCANPGGPFWVCDVCWPEMKSVEQGGDSIEKLLT